MSWDFSVLSRFRRPVRRPPAPEPPPQETLPQIIHDFSAQQLPIDRKILQDPSSLLEAEAQDDLPLGLTPSTRTPTAGGSGNTRSRARKTDLPSEPLSERSELPSGPSIEISSRTRSGLTISRISKTAAGGEWATFGRKRVVDLSRSTSSPDSPKRTSHSLSPTRDSKHLSADSTLSTVTLSRLTNPSRPSSSTYEGQPSPGSRSPRQSADVRFSSKASSPVNTMLSKLHPRTPQRPSSLTTSATPSVTNLTTPVNRELDSDSPRTFGHPTPTNNPVDSATAYPFPPPPLPPLNHAELPAILHSHSKSVSTGGATFSVLRDRSNTLSTNGHSPRKDDLLASLSRKLRHSARHQSSLARVKKASNTVMAEQHEAEPPEGRRRARTVSGGARERRTSADWSSYQASVGVNSHANQAWPAEVSREILRLSLAPTQTVPGSPEKRTRGRSADPVRGPDRGVKASPSFLPFPHPSQPTSPPPSTASATHPGQPSPIYLAPRSLLTPGPRPDGREAIPTRYHSLRFDLGNRTGSEQPGRFTMAEVRRSLSAIEARNGRNIGASGAVRTAGLRDPVPTMSGPPSQSLHTFSPPTPSRSLFSGRVSPNTLLSSSMPGEPSTPTPAPRQLSDKSRGKRKAEDNLDLTPPEQKKEGQRATFLLPSDSRSHRVSNSSHAPSSYHRKRARLSSSSPFATPAQSRPSSVQETPRSTSRNHHFTSLSSSTGARVATSRTPSRAASTRSRQPPTPSTTRKHERRPSMSQTSIPISAFISPHAPSISRSTKFHMRDPRKPPKKLADTPWGLRFATEDEPGSPIQAWCFFFGFLLFPIWWIAGLFLRVPTTRIAGDTDPEKGVAIDDPQIEHNARTWRFRCRVMTVVSFFTYIPFIVLVAIFVPR